MGWQEKQEVGPREHQCQAGTNIAGAGWSWEGNDQKGTSKLM